MRRRLVCFLVGLPVIPYHWWPLRWRDIWAEQFLHDITEFYRPEDVPPPL